MSDLPVLGNQDQPTVPEREADALTDFDRAGTQPADRGHVDIPPGGGQ
jgi:hypothetical protein